MYRIPTKQDKRTKKETMPLVPPTNEPLLGRVSEYSIGQKPPKVKRFIYSASKH